MKKTFLEILFFLLAVFLPSLLMLPFFDGARDLILYNFVLSEFIVNLLIGECSILITIALFVVINGIFFFCYLKKKEFLYGVVFLSALNVFFVYLVY